LVQFSSVFWTKTGSNQFGSVFFDLARFLFGLARFFLFFGLGLVRFGIFGFKLIKPKPNRTGQFFFKILIGLIGFFSQFDFLGYFFSSFLGFISFSVFLLTPTRNARLKLQTSSF